MLKIIPNPDPNSPKQQGMNLPPGGSTPKLVAKRDVMSQGFFANLKDFFSERPVKAPKNAAGQPFVGSQFGSGFGDNLKEWFRSAPKNVPSTMGSLRGADSPGIKVEWKPFYKTFFQNLRDFISPPKQAPFKGTSQPVKVREIWTKDEVFSRAQIVSFVFHGSIILLVVLASIVRMTAKSSAAGPSTIMVPIDISPYAAKLPPGNKPAGGGGGGGEHNPVPASKGKLPKFSAQQLAPPQLIRNPTAKLMVTPTLIGPDALRVPSPDMDRWGDPLGKMITDSNGPGSGGGMGSGSGGGIGSGNGGGLGPGSGGGTGGGVYRAGENGVGNIECVYCPHPDYSDEARKAKYAGEVLVEVTVLPNGKATNIRVIKSPGMGLDEKAIEAVRNWQFKPAIGPNGKPVAAMTQIQVIFQLF
jgi:protein TonB